MIHFSDCYYPQSAGNISEMEIHKMGPPVFTLIYLFHQNILQGGHMFSLQKSLKVIFSQDIHFEIHSAFAAAAYSVIVPVFTAADFSSWAETVSEVL